jgi:hypothetical protein
LGSALGVLVEDDDGTENGAVELLQFVGLVFRAGRVALCEIEMTLGVGQFL